MGVDLQTYRCRIGTYKFSSGLDVVTLECQVNFSGGLKTIGTVLFIGLLLLMAGIEPNPGPNTPDPNKVVGETGDASDATKDMTEYVSDGRQETRRVNQNILATKGTVINEQPIGFPVSAGFETGGVVVEEMYSSKSLFSGKGASGGASPMYDRSGGESVQDDDNESLSEEEDSKELERELERLHREEQKLSRRLKRKEELRRQVQKTREVNLFKEHRSNERRDTTVRTTVSERKTTQMHELEIKDPGGWRNDTRHATYRRTVTERTTEPIHTMESKEMRIECVDLSTPPVAANRELYFKTDAEDLSNQTHEESDSTPVTERATEPMHILYWNDNDDDEDHADERLNIEQASSKEADSKGPEETPKQEDNINTEVGQIHPDTAQETERHSDNQFRYILRKLDLEDRYEQQITVEEVLAVDTCKQRDKSILETCAWTLLSQILSVHSDARDNVLPREAQKRNRRTQITNIKNILENISDSNSSNKVVSPLDIFLAVFQCCDPMLKQLLVRKMYLCKLAVPFLYKDGSSDALFLETWSMQTLSIYHETTSNSAKRVLTIDTSVISFARLGRPQFSKSELLNGMLRGKSSPHQTFYCKDSQSGMVRRLLSTGYTEIFWLPPLAKPDDNTGSLFKKTLTLLNMRGALDRDFSNENIRFMNHLSDVVVVAVDNDYLADNMTTSFNILMEFSSVILIFTKPLMKDKKTHTMLERLSERTGKSLDIVFTHDGTGAILNSLDIIADVSHTISEKIVGNSTSVEHRMHSFERQTIVAVDDKDEFTVCKKSAESVYQQMQRDFNEWKHKSKETKRSRCKWKEIITPASYIQSKQIGQLVQDLAKSRPWLECESTHQKLKSLRQQQTNSVTNSVRDFINALVKISERKMQLSYFITWFQIILDEQIKGTIPELMRSRKKAQDALFVTKQNLDPGSSSDERRHLEIEVKQLDEDIEHASFGLEHFFRDIGHICDAAMELRIDLRTRNLPSVDEIASAFADIVIGGGGFELIDGDSFYMAKNWVAHVFQFVSTKLCMPRVAALSVLGLQSSGKSTLLNTMFGLHFSVSTGRCTRGIHSQLLAVQNAHHRNVPFSYILVIDSEGLRAPELADVNDKSNHDNQLATFVTGLGEITAMNIMGENFADIKDILEIVVHAFLRLKLANNALQIGQTCIFLHHNVTDKSARENMRDGYLNLVKILDKVTEESAQSEGIDNINSFNEVIKFNIESNIFAIPNLWQGIIPMTRVNTGYSESVAEIKHHIFQTMLTDCESKSFKPLAGFATKANDLWKGILAEDFVFSFRNSMEMKAYCLIDDRLCTLKWELETFAREELITLMQVEFSQCTDQHLLQSMEDRIIISFKNLLSVKKDDILKQVDEIFNTSECKEMVIKWKTSQILNIELRAEELTLMAITEIKRYHQTQFVEMTTSSVTKENRERIRKESLRLANKLKGIHLEQKEIDRQFHENIWTEYETAMVSKYLTIAEVKLEEAFIKGLYKYFDKQDRAKLIKALKSGNYLRGRGKICDLKCSFDQTEICTEDIKILGTWETFKDFFWTKDIMPVVRELCVDFFLELEDIVRKSISPQRELSEMDVDKFLAKIKKPLDDINCRLHERSLSSEKLSFTIKLYVHVCRYAFPIFEEHNVKYHSKHGIKQSLKKFKQTLKSEFDAELKGLQEEEKAAEVFCQAIEISVKELVSEVLPIQLVKALKDKFPISKSELIRFMCETLAKNEDFEAFIDYIKNPRLKTTDWMIRKCGHILFAEGLYYKTASENIAVKIQLIEYGIKMCAVKLKDKQRITMAEWLDTLKSMLTEPCIKDTNLELFLKRSPIQNIQFFTDIILRKSSDRNLLEQKQHILDIAFRTQGKASDLFEKVMAAFEGQIIDHIWGCREQCPFCREPCAKSDTHEGSKHVCVQHRPSCCRGAYLISGSTNLACLAVCNYDITTDTLYQCCVAMFQCNLGKTEPCKKEKHLYKEYKTAFPNWDIVPSTNMHDCAEYWMWFIGKFKYRLANKYGYDVSNVPSSWSGITKERAIASLEKYN